MKVCAHKSGPAISGRPSKGLCGSGVEPALGRAVRGITACPGLGIQLLALPVVIVIRRLAFPL